MDVEKNCGMSFYKKRQDIVLKFKFRNAVFNFYITLHRDNVFTLDFGVTKPET